MLELLADSALRSIVLGGGVWLGLALLRVRSPRLQMTAWTVVLAASLAMPVLTPWMRITLPADPPQSRLVKIAWTNASLIAAPSPAGRNAPGEKVAPGRQEKEGAANHSVAAAVSESAPAVANDSRRANALGWRALAVAVYACVTGAMLLRLLFGWLVMTRVVRAARPVCDGWAAGVDVRVSDVMRVPVAFASTILLPSSCTAWSAAKLRAVMLHEGSHVAHGDSYVLLLAAINRAAFWFNPFAWWLHTRLADLAEMISDDDAVAGLNDRTYYTDTLLRVARDTQALPTGLAMARPGTVRRRVRRILSMTAAPRQVGARTRIAIAVAIIPAAALSAVTLARGGAPLPAADRAGPAAPPAVHIPVTAGGSHLDRYAGRFAMGSSVLAVVSDGEQLFAQLSGYPQLRLIPVNEDTFIDERSDGHFAFAVKDGEPAATVTLRAGGIARRGARIDPEKADEMEAAFQRRLDEVAQRFSSQVPIPGAKAALFRMIDDLRRDTPSFERMEPQLADRMRRQLPQMQSALAALGPAEQAFFRTVTLWGADIYAVKFAKGSGEFRIELAADGTITSADFRADGDGAPGGTADCTLEPTLKAFAGAAPIRISLTNFSDDGFRLFSLDEAGQRTVSGEIAGHRGTDVWTAVGRPLVIADDAGQCREIVLPGQQTRFYGVQRSGASRGLSRTWRNTPVAGSEEALLQYLDSVRRGLPDYGRMTPEAAAAARQQLPLQRAVLDKLGALRVISFRNVGLAGDDVYALRFAEGSIQWNIRFAEDGRIQSIGLNPA
jgi:hypothetical protein